MNLQITAFGSSLQNWWKETPKPFAEAFNPRHNSIGFMRICLASLVIVSHSYPLGGHYGAEILSRISRGQETLGSIAVSGFFILSGFLIAGSYDHLKSMPRFLWHRILRIMPAFWTSLVVVALGFGAIFFYHYHHNFIGYLSATSGGPLSYIGQNFFLTMKQYDISNLSSHLVYPSAFDGSLWTLIYEFKCYLLVGALGFFGLIKSSRRLIVASLIGVYALYIANLAVPGVAAALMPPLKDVEMLKLLTVFLAGSVFYVYRDKIILSSRYFVLSLLLLLLTTRLGGLAIFVPPLLCYVLMYAATYLPIKSFDRKYDLSYGVYIYAFPVQQTFSLYGLNHLNIAIYCLLVLVCTLPLAFLSYVVIEKPSMKLKNIDFNPKIIGRFYGQLSRKRSSLFARLSN